MELVTRRGVFLTTAHIDGEKEQVELQQTFSTLDAALSTVANDYRDWCNTHPDHEDQGVLCITPSDWLGNEESYMEEGMETEDIDDADWEARTREGALWYSVKWFDLFHGPCKTLARTPIGYVPPLMMAENDSANRT